MTQTVNFKLTEAQQKKIIHARTNKLSVILRLNIGQKHVGGTPLLLTDREIQKLNDGNSHNITLPASRVGGLLPILPILGGLATLTGIATSIVNAVKSAKQSNAMSNAARAAEDLAKFRLASEQKSGTGLKRKRRK